MRIAFVGPSWHLRFTRSSQFFIDILRDVGRVTVIASEWMWSLVPNRSWDLVVFWQHMPDRELLDGVVIRRVVLIPMYDDCPKDPAFWAQYHDCVAVAFCKALANLLRSAGLAVHSLRYAPPVPSERVESPVATTKALIWPRGGSITWPIIRALLGTDGPRVLGLHYTSAPHRRDFAFAAADQSDFAVTETRWFPSPEAFFAHRAQYGVFFAPRETEGIGMAFLEAMLLGQAVIAPDGATMNEYIVSGRNGWLYDPAQPVAPDWTKAAAWGVQARQDAIEFRAAWLASLHDLKVFLAADDQPRTIKGFTPSAKRQRRRAQWDYALFAVWAPLRWASRLRRLVAQKMTRGRR